MRFSYELVIFGQKIVHTLQLLLFFWFLFLFCCSENFARLQWLYQIYLLSCGASIFFWILNSDINVFQVVW